MNRPTCGNHAGIHFFALAVLVVSLLSPEGAEAVEPGDCLECHRDLVADEVVHWAATNGCGNCHEGTHDLKTNRFAGERPAGLEADLPSLCFGCHEPEPFSRDNTHPALRKGCTRCHDPHSSSRAGLLKGPDPELCLGCHAESGMFEGKSVHAAIGLGCTICHSPHSSDEKSLLNAQPPNLCYTCHRPFDKKVQHPPITLCTNCHDPHASGSEKLLVMDVSKLCKDCHGEKKFKKRYTHGPVSLGLCTACHSPHDSDNEKLLAAPGAELCFLCHDREPFELKNVHPPVKKGECVKCHDPHAARGRFQLDGPINNVCGKCHPKVEKGLHVIQGFAARKHPLKGVPDPKRPGRAFACSGCHNPHSSDSVRLFRYPAERAFDVCKNCHEK